MGFFDKALKTVQSVGDSLVASATDIGSTAGTVVQDNTELTNIKMQINVIEQELDAAYVQIGKRYVDYVVKTGDMGNVDMADLLKLLDPKLSRKQELEEQLVELEKRMKQNALLRDKGKAQEEFEEEKTKLDRALAMDVITQDEYNFKISIAKKKVDNFEEIRRVEQQFDMGIITKEVAKWLLEQDKQSLVDKVTQETNEVVKRARESRTYNNLTERTAKQTALILMSVDMVKEVLHIELDKESIRDFMEEHSLVNNKEQVSIGKRAMEWLLQYISKNYTQFLSADSPETISNCRGRLERTQVVLLETNEESTMRLSIAESEFMKILKEGKFSEKITVLKDWKNMGYLKCQKDRYVSQVKIIGDIKVKGYIIQLPVSDDRVVKSVTINGRLVDKYDEHSVFSIDDEEDDDLNFPEDNE